MGRFPVVTGRPGRPDGRGQGATTGSDPTPCCASPTVRLAASATDKARPNSSSSGVHGLPAFGVAPFRPPPAKRRADPALLRTTPRTPANRQAAPSAFPFGDRQNEHLVPLDLCFPVALAARAVKPGVLHRRDLRTRAALGLGGHQASRPPAARVGAAHWITAQHGSGPFQGCWPGDRLPCQSASHPSRSSSRMCSNARARVLRRSWKATAARCFASLEVPASESIAHMNRT